MDGAEREGADEAEVVTRATLQALVGRAKAWASTPRWAPQASFQQSGDGSSWVWVRVGGGLVEGGSILMLPASGVRMSPFSDSLPYCAGSL